MIARAGRVRGAARRGALAWVAAAAACCLLASSAQGFAQLNGSPFTAGYPGAVAFSADGSMLAVGDAPGAASSVTMYSYNSVTGTMTAWPGHVSPGTFTPSLAFSPNDQLLAAVSYRSNEVWIYSVNASTQTLTAVPGAPFSIGGASAYAGELQFSPNGDFLAVTDPGSGTVSVFAVNQTTGALTPTSGSPIPVPRSSLGRSPTPVGLAFNPQGNLLAVLDVEGEDVTMFSFNQSTGALALAAGHGWEGLEEPTSVVFTPDGAHLAVVAKDSGDPNPEDRWAWMFSVNQSTGGLSGASAHPIGEESYSISFSPTAELAAVDTNNEGTHLYSLEQATGALTEVPSSPLYTGVDSVYFKYFEIGGGSRVAFSPAGGLFAVANYAQQEIFLYTTTPTIVDDPTTSITQTSAVLNATVNPDGAGMYCAFADGPHIVLPCPVQGVSGFTPIAESYTLDDLQPNRAYSFYVTANNDEGNSPGSGTYYGQYIQFTTLPELPKVAAGVAVHHESPGVVELDPQVNPEGASTTCVIQYGTSTSYGSSAACSPEPGSGTGLTTVTATIGELQPSTPYHFRVVATNGGGTTYGTDETFTTGAIVESDGTAPGPVEVIGPAGATVSALTSAQAPAGLPAGDFAAVGSLSYEVTGLTPGQTIEVTLILPAGAPTPTAVYKYDDATHTYASFTQDAVIDGDDITLTLTDGGAGDADGLANGTIVDPVVPVYHAPPPTLPEIGRCQRLTGEQQGSKTVYDGSYTNARCTTASAGHTGRYEWAQGYVRGGFKGEGGASTLETAGGTKITCTASTTAGRYTAGGEVARITFEGCTNAASHAKCQTAGSSEGLIETSRLAGPIGFLSGEKPSVGVQLSPLSPSEPYFAEFECGGGPGAEWLEGSVVGKVPTLDRMSTTLNTTYRQSKGKQALQELEGQGPADLELAGPAGLEEAGLKSKSSATGEEALEIKAKA